MQLKTTTIEWLIIGALFCAGILVQSHLILDSDISWLMEVCRRFLHGGSYQNSFFESNPPMSFFLYIPAVLLQYFSLGTVVAVRVYVFFLCALSLLLCFDLFRRIFVNKEKLIFLLMLFLTFAFTWLPGFDFAQREHIAVVLIMPYLLLNVLRLKNIKIADFYAGIIALVAGVGFVIKPYFLIPLVLLAGLNFIRRKEHNYFIYPEVIIAAVYLLYGLTIFLFTPDYLTFILPFNLRFYYYSYSYYWITIFTHLIVFYSVAVLAFYLLQRKRVKNNPCGDVFAVAAVGFLIVYIVGRTNWFYHYLPALILFGVLGIIALWEFAENMGVNKTKLDCLFLGLISLAIIGIPVHFFYGVYVNRNQRLIHDGHWSELVSFFNSQQPKTAFVFSVAHLCLFPLVDYTNIIATTRFPSLIYLAPLTDPGITNDVAAMKKIDEYKNMVVMDLIKDRPHWVFIDDSIYGDHIRFDYFECFKSVPGFEKWWQDYHYVKSIGDFKLYERS